MSVAGFSKLVILGLKIRSVRSPITQAIKRGSNFELGPVICFRSIFVNIRNNNPEKIKVINPKVDRVRIRQIIVRRSKDKR